MLAYYRNKQTGEIKPVEQDSLEMFELQREVGRDNHSLWEQTSVAHTEAIKERAAIGALTPEDLGKEHGEAFRNNQAALDVAEVGPEQEPWRNLTPGEIEAGLTPGQKQSDLEAMFAEGSGKRDEVLSDARDLHVDKKDRKDRANQQAKGMRARAGGSDVREDAPVSKTGSGKGGEVPTAPAPSKGDNPVAAQ